MPPSARTAHPLPRLPLLPSHPICSLSLFLFGPPLYPFPSVKPFPVKSGGQLTVRIRTRSACIIYFQRALPSPTAETSGLEHGSPTRPFQIHLSELRVTCCAFVPRPLPPPSLRSDEERITIRVLPIYRAVPSPNRCARFNVVAGNTRRRIFLVFEPIPSRDPE